MWNIWSRFSVLHLSPSFDFFNSMSFYRCLASFSCLLSILPLCHTTFYMCHITYMSYHLSLSYHLLSLGYHIIFYLTSVISSITVISPSLCYISTVFTCGRIKKNPLSLSNSLTIHDPHNCTTLGYLLYAMLVTQPYMQVLEFPFIILQD